MNVHLEPMDVQKMQFVPIQLEVILVLVNLDLMELVILVLVDFSFFFP